MGMVGTVAASGSQAGGFGQHGDGTGSLGDRFLNIFFCNSVTNTNVHRNTP